MSPKFFEGKNLENSSAETPPIRRFGLTTIQRVPSPFFSDLRALALTFNEGRLYLSRTCLTELPDMDYIQLLINVEEKKIIIKPASMDDKDAFSIRSPRGASRRITCPVFFAKVAELLEWNPEYRYRIRGTHVNNGKESLLVFDLTAFEAFLTVSKNQSKKKGGPRRPQYPADWKNRFGFPHDGDRKQLIVDTFDEYSVFSLEGGYQPNKKREKKNE